MGAPMAYKNYGSYRGKRIKKIKAPAGGKLYAAPDNGYAVAADSDNTSFFSTTGTTATATNVVVGGADTVSIKFEDD